MNKYAFLLTVLLLLGCKSTQTVVVVSNQLPTDIHQLTYPLPVQPAISAHRGGKYIDSYPENCLETFQYITKDYVMIIECDVAQTADGTLILMHDNSIDRTTASTGKVANLPYSEIQNLTLLDHNGKATPYRIPTLEKVLQWAEGRAILSLDIKRTVDREKLLNLLKANGADTYSEIITYNYESAVYYAENAPEYRLSVGIRNEEELQNYLQSDIAKSSLKPFVGTRRKDKAFYDRLHDMGLVVTLGTLGNIDQQAQAKGYQIYDTLVQQGVDVFATDYPLEVAKYYYGNKQSSGLK